MKINEKHFSLYMDNILSKTSSKLQKVFLILSARGFLFKTTTNKLELSELTSNTDRLSLNKFLTKNFLGKIEDHTISLNSNCNAYSFAKIFTEKISASHPAQVNDKSWSDFQANTGDKRVSVLKLDPFIASYVNALSLIGIEISEASDGNSPTDNFIKLHFASKYDLIWHKVVDEVFLTDSFATDLWQRNKTTQEAKLLFGFSQLSKYRKLLQEADYIHQNRAFLHTAKLEIIKKLNDENSCEQLECMSSADLYETLLLNSQKIIKN